VTETSAATAGNGGGSDDQERPTGLLPTTKQAIQVAVAASLAIVVGELVSPSRWYWAVIAAFVIFAGTNTWNETFTKGWARLIGTALGVPAGMLVAAVVSGNRTASLVLIFVCVFCSLYFLKVAYSMMTFWITTMLALLYGLLGEFSYKLLLLRIEETAIGAVIGMTVAILVLPTNARTAMRTDARVFLTTLADVIETSVATLFGREVIASPTDKARQLDRDLQQFRTSAKPLAAGVGGSFPANIQSRVATAVSEITRLSALRSEAQASQSALAVVNAYSTPITDMIALNDQIAQGTSDSILVNDVQTLNALSLAKDQAAQQRALLVGKAAAVGAADQHRATIRAFEQPGDMEQGRFPGA